MKPTARDPDPDDEPAELSLRFAAVILDVALLAVLADGGSRVATWILSSSVVRPPTGAADPTIVLLALVVPLFLTFGVQLGLIVVFLRRFDGTPGQLALGISTVASGTGAVLSRGGAWLRMLVVYLPAAIYLSGSFLVATIKQLSTVVKNPMEETGGLETLVIFGPIVWALIILVSIQLSRDGQGIHDRLTRSVVVRAESTAS